MDIGHQLVQGQGRGRGRQRLTTSTVGHSRGRGRGRGRAVNSFSQAPPMMGLGHGQEGGSQEISEAGQSHTGTARIDVMEEQPNLERIPGLNGGVTVQAPGRSRGRGRGREQLGPNTSTGGAGRGRGRGRSRGRGRGRGSTMRAQEAEAEPSSTNESEQGDMEVSDVEAHSHNSDELPGSRAPAQDAPEAEPFNEAQLWRPPCPRLFTLQKSHWSEMVINGSNPGELTIRHHRMTLDWDDRYKPYLLQAGLYGVHQIGYILADSSLITALVERWRPETHTFNLPVGEMDVTLQDVAMLFGLRIDGDPIYEDREKERNRSEWSALINTYLSRPVDDETFRSRSKIAIKISWIQKHFQTCPEEDEAVPYFARAYMLMLVGSVLFTDLTGDSVPVTYLPFIANLEGRTYSWGSAVLAYLHKELCRTCLRKANQIGGPVLLLQLWSWARFLFGRPEPRDRAQRPVLGGDVLEERPPFGYTWSGLHKWTNNPVRALKYYRDEIDLMREYQVNWMPYEESHDLLPPICLELSHFWLCKAPLIDLGIVEPYNPHRVMRQFGKYQDFPPINRTNAVPFKCTKSLKRSIRRMHVGHWNRRLHFQIEEDRLYDGTPTFYEKYMKWYAQIPYCNSSFREPWAHLTSTLSSCLIARAPNNCQACKELKKMAEDALERRQETAEVGTRAFALDMLLGLKKVRKVLGHNVESDDTFLLLKEQPQLEEQGEEAQGPGGEAPNPNRGRGSASDEPESSGSKRLRGG